MGQIEDQVELLERDERALEKAASALDRLATIAEKFFEKMYPEKQLVRDAVLTTVKTAEEEELEETIQGTERTLDQWRDIGPREKEFIEKAKSKQGSKG